VLFNEFLLIVKRKKDQAYNCNMGNFTLTQMALPLLVKGGGARVRSWVQDPPSVCNLTIKKKRILALINFYD
jgi:hypothetical protein